jgi:hypothetical protein
MRLNMESEKPKINNRISLFLVTMREGGKGVKHPQDADSLETPVLP